MPDFSDRYEKLINDLRPVIQNQTKYEKARKDLQNDRGNPTFDAQMQAVEQLIAAQRTTKYLLIEQLLRYPPFHDQHQQFMEEFQGKTPPGSPMPFDKNVFIMTKYPDVDANGQPKSAADKELQSVIAAVQAAVTASGCFPRVASDREFYGDLWDNVELYLLGCARGIAILESQYRPELNPNVAMEWGWMRGMGKPVFMLVEDSFKYLRADWGGLIEHKFAWSDPAASIAGHVTGWLNGGSAKTASAQP